MSKRLIIDTNVLIQDPYCLDSFLQGENLVILPWPVLLELDGLKEKNQVSQEARQVLRRIEELLATESSNLKIERRMKFEKSWDLNTHDNDHKILAIINTLLQETETDSKVRFITQDRPLRILAQLLFSKFPNFVVENYKNDEIKKENGQLLKLYNKKEVISEENEVKLNEEEKREISENQGVICSYMLEGEAVDESYYPCVKKGDELVLVRNNIKASNIKPYINGIGKSWEQFIALHHLLDSDIAAIFIKGEAGTGKTLLSIAAGLQQREKYDSVIISRPAIRLSDKDNMGFLPGDISEKMSPWLLPIKQNLKIIGENNTKKKEKFDFDYLVSEGRIAILPLDYIRGASISNSFIIVDEAQNLTAHQVKTILSRVGKGSKIVFTGDVKQIDITTLDERSNGLSIAIERLKGSPLIASVNLTKVIRSPLTQLVIERF